MKKASAKITLVLVGATMLHGCGRDVETRDLYLTHNDCVADWGDEKKCESRHDERSGRRYYFGPAYSSERPAQAPRQLSNAVGTRSVARGGFGTSAGAHASSGS